MYIFSSLCATKPFTSSWMKNGSSHFEFLSSVTHRLDSLTTVFLTLEPSQVSLVKEIHSQQENKAIGSCH